ncbi:MAG: hypothetical protein LC808_05060 [Actinobacteria bacterium]|nr:hypothetical protein [Actinomycetota bacterium]
MSVTLQELVSSIESATDTPLDQLAEASITARQLEEVSDALVTHFVERCRSTDASWAEIGKRLGVTRQAVQKRFSEEVGVASYERPARGHQEHHGKYRPLWSWLQEQKSDRLLVKFADLERRLGFPLPASSRKHQAHWHSYDGSAVVRAIVDAGWRAHRVDLANETVVFIRG